MYVFVCVRACLCTCVFGNWQLVVPLGASEVEDEVKNLSVHFKINMKEPEVKAARGECGKEGKERMQKCEGKEREIRKTEMLRGDLRGFSCQDPHRMQGH